LCKLHVVGWSDDLIADQRVIAPGRVAYDAPLLSRRERAEQ
jgi:hypothetical protein